MKRISIALVCVALFLFMTQFAACSDEDLRMQENSNTAATISETNLTETPNSYCSSTEQIVDTSEFKEEKSYCFEDFDALRPGESTDLDLFEIVHSALGYMYGRAAVYVIPADQGQSIIIVSTNTIDAIYLSDHGFNWTEYDLMVENPDLRPEKSRFKVQPSQSDDGSQIDD